MRTDDSAPASAPLVSFIVRSMGRPELRDTLESIARQDHPSIDVVIVDATGGRHPALPSVDWPLGHTVRLVSCGEPLKRPQAATLGLESARGAWFTFLDDDDTCEPAHVSTLVAAVRSHAGALVVYGCGRLCDRDGRVEQVFGRPFNRALMHYGPLFYWQSALISVRVRDLGCRFDPALEVCEDRDFLAQIAEHGDFVFVPTAATFNYRPDLGTSGTGNGANRNAARVARFENLLRAKWAGQGIYHNERAAVRCRSGVRAYFDGDLEHSRAAFASALADYPDDPNAVHGLARVAYALGDLATAEQTARRAIEINPAAAEYRTTLTDVLAAIDVARARAARPVPRLAACPCGSGQRYKACCGRLAGDTPNGAAVVTVSDPLLKSVDHALERGEAEAARALLSTAVTGPDASRQRLVVAARVALELNDADAAFALLQRAAAHSVDAEVGLLLDACCQRLADQARRTSLWVMVSRVCNESARRAAGAAVPTSRPVIRVAASNVREQLRQANELRAALEVHADVALIPTPDGSALPSGSTLVVFNHDDVVDLRPGSTSPVRIVIRGSRDDPEAILKCLARLQEAWPDAALRCTLPHVGILDDQAAMQVDYPWIDPALLRVPLPEVESALVVGRHGPCTPRSDHPNDGALYRALLADGHRIDVPASVFLRRAFADDPHSERLRLRDDHEGEADPQSIGIALFRGAYDVSGAADARILESMAAARPVVAFAHGIGAREWLLNGRTGFIVETEQEARSCIATLAASPGLRREHRPCRPRTRRLGDRTTACTRTRLLSRRELERVVEQDLASFGRGSRNRDRQRPPRGDRAGLAPHAVADAAVLVAAAHVAADELRRMPERREVAALSQCEAGEHRREAQPRHAVVVDHDVALVGVADVLVGAGARAPAARDVVARGRATGNTCAPARATPG